MKIENCIFKILFLAPRGQRVKLYIPSIVRRDYLHPWFICVDVVLQPIIRHRPSISRKVNYCTDNLPFLEEPVICCTNINAYDINSWFKIIFDTRFIYRIFTEFRHPMQHIYFSISRGHSPLPTKNSQRTSHSSTFRASVWLHYGDVIMGTIASQITSLTMVYSTVYSGTDQRKHQSCANGHWPLCGEFTGDWWIPCTNGQ